MHILIAIMIWLNAQPDPVRYEYCDTHPQVVARMERKGFTVYEDCSVVPPADYTPKGKGR